MRVLTFDIGGSSIKQSIVSIAGGRCSSFERFSPIQLHTRKFSELEVAVNSVVRMSLDANSGIDRIAISTTGSVDNDGIVINAGHFDDYKNVDWDLVVRDGADINSGVEVHVLNDGRASAIAEYSELCNSDNPTLIHVAVGTGIGGAIVMSGSPITGDSGFAGNFGHMKVARESRRRCSCGSHGCVEALASGPAISTMFSFRKNGSTDDAEGNFRDVLEYAKHGDSLALDCIREAGGWLGISLSYAINIINPSFITVGGGVGDACERLRSIMGFNPFLQEIDRVARENSHRRPSEKVRILAAKHGNDGGMIGAAIYAQSSKTKKRN